ncbi:MAG: hypothetical protein ABI425_00970 [Patescibacteria group bacterium]
MKRVLLSLLIFSLTLVVFHTYFRSGFPYTNDGENHLARFANYKIALKEGQFPPRFAPNLMNHYGYPVFNFNYPLPNLLSVPFSLIKVNPETTFKIISIMSFIGGLLGVYKLLHSERKSLFIIVIGMVLFGIQPYIVNLILFRGSMGELLAASLLPWVFWSINELIKKQKPTLFTISISSLYLLSHNVTVLISLPIILLFAVVKIFDNKNKKAVFAIFLNFFYSLALSLWFWLPALVEASQTVVRDAGIANHFFDHFATINQLAFGQLGFGFSNPGPVDSLGFQLGISTLFVIWISSIILFKSFFKKVHVPTKILLWTTTVLILIFLQTPTSFYFWKLVPTLQIIQFPWRLSILLGALVPILWAESSSLISRNLKKVLLALCFITVYVIGQLKPVDFFHRNQIDYDLYPQSTSTQNENRTKEFTYLNIGDWQPRPLIEGVGESTVSDWTGSHRTYSLSLETPSTIIEPTMKFSGWQTSVVSSDGKTRNVQYLNTELTQGRIAFELPIGTFLIHSTFTQWTPARIIGNSITLISVIALGFGYLKHRWTSSTTTKNG